MNERHAARKQLIYYMRAFDKATEQQLGQVVDITEDGFMLVSHEPIEEDAKALVRIRLPKRIGGVDDLEINAVCRWCKRDSNPEFFRIGYEVLEIAPNDLAVVRTLIDEYEFESDPDYDFNIEVDESGNR